MIKVIALSGGPCGGKTTALKILSQQSAYTVVTMPEAATQIIAAGKIPGENGLTRHDFQRLVLHRQLELEETTIARAREQEKTNKSVAVVLDRSLLDQLAYLDKSDFEVLLAEVGLSLSQVITRYDAIIHLETAAIGTNCYTAANNATRSETAVQAAAIDKRTLAANSLFPGLMVIDNSTDFAGKMARLQRAVDGIMADKSVLGQTHFRL